MHITKEPGKTAKVNEVAVKKDASHLRLVYSRSEPVKNAGSKIHNAKHGSSSKLRGAHESWTDRIRETVHVDKKQTLELMKNRELCLLRMVQSGSPENVPCEIERLISGNIANIESRLHRFNQLPELARAS